MARISLASADDFGDWEEADGPRAAPSQSAREAAAPAAAVPVPLIAPPPPEVLAQQQQRRGGAPDMSGWMFGVNGAPLEKPEVYRARLEERVKRIDGERGRGAAMPASPGALDPRDCADVDDEATAKPLILEDIVPRSDPAADGEGEVAGKGNDVEALELLDVAERRKGGRACSCCSVL
eukprot:m51a1_g13843 hypothetical protein (179) ;mRNA; r:529207-529743